VTWKEEECGVPFLFYNSVVIGGGGGCGMSGSEGARSLF
jgi:hypothetical protein